jgi:hypothetical protein
VGEFHYSLFFFLWLASISGVSVYCCTCMEQQE